ncbi:hypothetical protein HRG_002576 [Hirsutella rhossiliensis]|uniref:Uncharacterized protein n=1 Tax=Hirsutella rhossiliensis TaxID=111463 RepID=A0A9P8N9N3_9HYPO|nr:uncharacterized protein HRG_02576 [Hirsutella rhossiliensis]KAH0967167.1 hypothetical protein HRG_02576 [Hirsutella rhossiliensis]
MRFSLAITSLLASTATAGVGVADVTADANVNVDGLVDGDVDVNAKVLPVHHGSFTDADGDDADIYDADFLDRRQELADVDVDADVDVLVSRHADGKVDAARRAAKSFKCPSGLSYCPWTKSCACAPGQKLDHKSKKCGGKRLTGAWPEPKTDVYGSKGVKLDTYCAISPYRIVKYSRKHEYCQASLNTIAFVAAADIALEISALVEIDVEADISVDLKAVVAGLAGLYLESVIDAVVLFNTNVFGHSVLQADVAAHVSLGLLGNLGGVFCAVGLGKCNFDCVSYSTKGCKNYIDVDAEIGANLEGLVGLCILPNILLIVNAAKVVVTVAVDGLLCLVGGLLGGLLRIFNCNCS